MENKINGILYGIGTGPGDSALMTNKALQVLSSCEVIALPALTKESCAAYKIIKNIFPQIDEKEFLFLDFPMTKDKAHLEKTHTAAAEKICSVLQNNKNVGFPTVGDITVYSTFSYIQKLVEEKNFKTVLINGIPSFCAAAAKLGISLSEQEEEIHIIPGSYDIKNSFNLKGTLIFMKSGKNILQLKDFLLQKEKNYSFDFYAVSNCGMENEKIYKFLNELPEAASYWTIVIIKNIREKNPGTHYKFFQNTKCENFPCHKTDDIENFNCLFCYCPLYFLGDKCGGNFKYTDKGIKSCIGCDFPHQKKNYDLIKEKLIESRNAK